MIDIEKQREHFKDHIATFTDYGNIKILDFQKPGTSHYRIRFLFEEDYHRLHISGDLGELIAWNYNNMCYEKFGDFLNNTGYFESKVCCHDRPFYEWDSEKARKELLEYFIENEIHFDEYDWETEEEARNDKIADLLDDFDCRSGFGSKAYEIMSDIDDSCWEWLDNIGKEETGILDLYMLAFELAQEQLKKGTV